MKSKITLAKSDLERFWSFVNKNGPIRPGMTTPCWEWIGYKKNGYGAFSLNGQQQYAHRMSYEMSVGRLPEKHNACHKCDFPPCVRDDHLFPGKQDKNLEDMREKGRGSEPPHTTGESHPLANLPDSQIENVRADARTMKQRDVGRKYGICQGTVWKIVHKVGRFEDKVSQ